MDWREWVYVITLGMVLLLQIYLVKLQQDNKTIKSALHEVFDERLIYE